MANRRKRKKGILAAVLVLLGGIALVAAVVLSAVLIEGRRITKYPLAAKAVEQAAHADKIHFLNTGSTDCILLESNGRFALVDCAEDTDNVRGFAALELQGYEDEVIAYLKQVAADENGKVTLDWVLGTHAHSDHIGGFDSVINDPDITVKAAYLKQYDATYIDDFEVEEWDNQEVYDQMLAACAANGVAVIQELPTQEWMFEDFAVQFFNTALQTQQKTGENENAVGTRLKIHGKTVFLAADINYLNQNTEKRIAPAIGKVDMLKLGHHGYEKSSSVQFLRTLDPEICIMTNKDRTQIETAPVRWRISLLTSAPIYTTGENNGIIAEFTDGEIKLSKEIYAHPAE